MLRLAVRADMLASGRSVLPGFDFCLMLCFPGSTLFCSLRSGFFFTDTFTFDNLSEFLCIQFRKFWQSRKFEFEDFRIPFDLGGQTDCLVQRTANVVRRSGRSMPLNSVLNLR